MTRYHDIVVSQEMLEKHLRRYHQRKNGVVHCRLHKKRVRARVKVNGLHLTELFLLSSPEKRKERA